MNCRLFRRHIDAFVDGELDPATQIEFERHVAVCPQCQEHLAFERAFKMDVRRRLCMLHAPDALRARIHAALREAPAPVPYREQGMPLIRFVPVRARYAVPIAAAAALGLAFFYGLDQRGAPHTNSAGALPILEDVVRLHSSELPADVKGPAADPVVSYFRGRVEFPVRPAEFTTGNARLMGARLANVRDRRAAALYYNVRGRRVTVVVFSPPARIMGDIKFQTLAIRRPPQRQDVYYQRVHGYTVPVLQHDGVAYALTGDLGQTELLRLAASARMH